MSLPPTHGGSLDQTGAAKAASTILARTLSQLEDARSRHDTATHASPQALRAGPLYDGLSGLVLLRVESARLNDRSVDQAQLARDFDQLMAYTATLPDARFGFMDGYLGVAYLLARWRAISADTSRDADIAHLLTRVERAADQAVNWDFVGGGAGAIHALLACEQFANCGPALALAQRLAVTLRRSARAQRRGLSWDTAAPSAMQNFTGFAHGPSGAASAFLALHDRAPSDWYLAAAADAFRYEDQFFSDAHQNWYNPRDLGVTRYEWDADTTALLDALRHGVNPRLGYAEPRNAWCYGAPGMVPPRCHLARLGFASPADDLVRRAIRAQLALLATPGNLSLCHGDIGNADLMLTAARIRHDTALEADVRSWATDALAHLATNESAWHDGTPAGQGELNLMQGKAGLGYFALRLLHAETPSLLYPAETWTTRGTHAHRPAGSVASASRYAVDAANVVDSVVITTPHHAARAAVIPDASSRVADDSMATRIDAAFEALAATIPDLCMDLTRFRGRLTRPNFGAEVAHGIEQEGRPA